MNSLEIVDTINVVLSKRGLGTIDLNTDARLDDVGFRSMDFSEVALRLEDASGKELVFDAAELRRIETFQDVIQFFLSSFGLKS